MARSSKKDILDRFRWSVEIEGFGASGSRAGFSIIQTPSYQITTKEYPEGGAHLQPKQIVDTISYQPVELIRGVTKDIGFDVWARGPFDATQIYDGIKPAFLPNTIVTARNAFGGNVIDRSNNPPTEIVYNIDQYRRDVIIKHLSRTGKIVKIYTLKNCLPIEYKPASDFDASADSEVSVEKLVLKYESFEVTSEEGISVGKYLSDFINNIF